MGLRKCPKCELNYIREDEKYCDVCRRAMSGMDNEDTVGMCIECGENPVVRGSDLCAACLRERRRQEKLDKAATVTTIDELDLSGVALDEIEVPISHDIPESEMEEIDKELGDGMDDEEDEESEEADAHEEHF